MPTPKKLKIWFNSRFPREEQEHLELSVAPHELISSASLEASNLVLSGDCPRLHGCDIAYGQPNPGQVLETPSLRWVHLTSAGYTAFDREDFRNSFRERGGMLTNSSSVYAEPCAQHAAAFMLAQARRLPDCFRNQNFAKGWPDGRVRHESRLLCGQKILMLGFGTIGKRLAELLEPYRMEIIAYKRKPENYSKVTVIGTAEVDRYLSEADHVMNILPLNADSRGFMSRERFQRMKRGTIFYNIGRGPTVDQDGLLQVLRDGHLGGAYLDVTDPEPLPAGHPLWAVQNCFITPHSAGGFREEFRALVDHFTKNLRLFERGMPLNDRVY